ncbi:sodium:proton antiporter [Muricauda sp. CAU 1633]|uniref:cation:proton antiporter n=1 Tax=Allomuricauda sp. CAU 1633 TaxID=2816036 RepID=UPI001A8EC6F0|nr:sodium:proton antiporter [Muricauda sp. CAU 1633]MBO0322259.1 sodium:proton antiporter [Muricauda sp. CAU 1633]
MFEIIIGIVALAALLSFINAKALKLPETIGVMLLSIAVSLFLGTSSFLHRTTFAQICQIVDQIEFREILFDFLLGILLFAGSIHVDLSYLLKQKLPIMLYATLGVILSTFLIGTLFYYVTLGVGHPMDYLFCLVFGALISPTDPVAVLAILRKANAPKRTEIKVVGESLFNDGVGIVVFLSIYSLATMMQEFELSHIVKEFSLEAGGGILMGACLGFLGRTLVQKVVSEPIIAVHISLAIVLGGYSLSSLLHVSGALAMVVAGLIMGQGLSLEKTPEKLKQHMGIFWNVLDEIFNAVLFVLIGIEVISLKFELVYLPISILSILIIILSRYVVIFVLEPFLPKAQRAGKKERMVLTWAGLRGGISIALALTLPESEIRDAIVFTTYIVVVFSIVVQGLTIEKLLMRTYK